MIDHADYSQVSQIICSEGDTWELKNSETPIRNPQIVAVYVGDNEATFPKAEDTAVSASDWSSHQPPNPDAKGHTYNDFVNWKRI